MDYSHEPTRPRHLIVHKEQPFNAEPPLPALVSNFITPTDNFFKRNHGPIPSLSANHECNVIINDRIVDSFTRSDLQTRYTPISVTAAIQCAGNRRRELHEVKEVRGVIWDSGTIGNAIWTGAKLWDILKPHTSDMECTVEFEAEGGCVEQQRYVASIPLLRIATTPVLIAWDMNHQGLSRDHGFPLRVIVPGVIGARSVKWLSTIRIINGPSNSFFQQKDYKLLPPHVNKEDLSKWWHLLPEINELNVTSVICEPPNNSTLPLGSLLVRGYAMAGGGRRIQRVDISIDDGTTWECADLLQHSMQNGSDWSWTLWSIRVEVTKLGPLNITSRACNYLSLITVDSSCNGQPDKPVWNYRGVMNNCWYKVQATAKQ